MQILRIRICCCHDTMLITGINVTYSLYVYVYIFPMCVSLVRFVSVYLWLNRHLFVHSQFVNCMWRFYIASADLLTRKETGTHTHFSNSSIFIQHIFYTYASKSMVVCVRACGDAGVLCVLNLVNVYESKRISVHVDPKKRQIERERERMTRIYAWTIAMMNGGKWEICKQIYSNIHSFWICINVITVLFFPPSFFLRRYHGSDEEIIIY